MTKRSKQPIIVYVVTHSEDGVYTEMARLSIAALRISNPNSWIKVVCDLQHATSGLASNKKLEKECNEYIPMDVKEGSAVERSRALKIRLRQHISGKFLYLDSDTIPIDNLERIYSIKGDIGLALDLNQRSTKYIINPKVKKLYQELDWPCPRNYHNGGIILWQDTTRAREFADLWYKNWKITCEAGNPLDQPSLNHSIESMECNVSRLKPRYNAMVERESWGFCRPAILHFINWKRADQTTYHAMVQQQIKTGIIDTEQLTKLITTGFPWTCDKSISRQIACGRYRRALSHCVKRILP